jgi:hypothetical protein
MAEKLLSRSSNKTAALGHEPTAVTSTGDVISYGDLVKIQGEGTVLFKFRYARHEGQEITVFGGRPGQEQMRSFRIARVKKVVENKRAAAVAETRSAADLTPAQKAALTKKLRAAS